MRFRNARMSRDKKCYHCGHEYTVFRACPNQCGKMATAHLTQPMCEDCWETGIQKWCPRCGMNAYEAQQRHADRQCDEIDRMETEGEGWKDDDGGDD